MVFLFFHLVTPISLRQYNLLYQKTTTTKKLDKFQTFLYHFFYFILFFFGVLCLVRYIFILFIHFHLRLEGKNTQKGKIDKTFAKYFFVFVSTIIPSKDMYIIYSFPDQDIRYETEHTKGWKNREKVYRDIFLFVCGLMHLGDKQ